MKQSLYNIELEYLALIDQIEEAEGELTPEMETALVINKQELQQKAVAYVSVIKERKSFVATIDDEIKRLQGMKKANINLIDRLEENILTAVKIYGAFEAGLLRFGTRKSEVVEVEDINLLPKAFKRITVKTEADKVEIKRAIKAGKKVKGAKLVENLNLKIS